MAFLGIDLGTGGVRCLLVEEDGTIQAESSGGLRGRNLAEEDHWSEQDPDEWISVLEGTLDELFANPANRKVEAIAVDSTSGTVLPVAEGGRPLGMALLYNDMRSREQAEKCGPIFGGACSPTFSLPKILWMQEHLDLPEDCLFLHATDYLNSWLTGSTEVPTDFTNALKSGADLETGDWSQTLPDVRLPAVVPPGRRFGVLRKDLCRRWQLSGEVALVSGATDSNAAFYASGAAGPGDWSSTVGTTLAVKGLSEVKLEDSQARIYCHRHPDGSWLPGGASNAGGEIVRRLFGERLGELEMAARERDGTDHLVYPSVRRGERLPFAEDCFEPFFVGREEDEVGVFLACLEGVSFVEALVFELIESLGGTVGENVFATGGATLSLLGLEVRANVLQKRVRVPAHPSSAMGAAILAAAGFHGEPVGEWSRRMVSITQTIEPSDSRRSYYRDRLAIFREHCYQGLS